MWYTANGSLNELYTPTLSFTEYTIEGFNQVRTKPPINYQDYIGKWGKFWDIEEHIVIDKLMSIQIDKKRTLFYANKGYHYIYFEPLTSEQLRILELI